MPDRFHFFPDSPIYAYGQAITGVSTHHRPPLEFDDIRCHLCGKTSRADLVQSSRSIKGMSTTIVRQYEAAGIYWPEVRYSWNVNFLGTRGHSMVVKKVQGGSLFASITHHYGLGYEVSRL